VATVFADSEDYPSFADLSADFVYARLMKTATSEPTGYVPDRIAFWSRCARDWAEGGTPEGVPTIEAANAAPAMPRDVFMFFISGAKERAPAAAVATLAELGWAPSER
jgi:uncharacterized protein YecE (DUF72 family)